MIKVVNRSDVALCSADNVADEDLRSISAIETILIHRNTAAGTIEGLRDFHSSGQYVFSLFPYHFFLDYSDGSDADGSRGIGDVVVNQIHPLNVISSHAAGRNRSAIGIALNVDGRKYPPSGVMLSKVAALCAIIHSAYPRTSVFGHSALKQCPGKLVPVQWIAARAEQLSRFTSPDCIKESGIRIKHGLDS